MEEKFKSWMIRSERKLESTANNYSRAIHSLSEHYSSFTGIRTDIYFVDLKQLAQIKDSYESNGRFAEEGHFRHGLNRAAIKALYRFKLSYPEAPFPEIKRNAPKPIQNTKKPKHKNIIQKIAGFLKRLFKRTKHHKAASDTFVGTKRQIFKRLLPMLPTWEKETTENYLVENLRCERCKSMEFPRVVERHPTNPKNLLNTILNDFPENQKQSISISDLAAKYKNKFTFNGNRLIVLCRSCNQKEEARKIERYRHEMPPIMRKDPPELRY
jgi:hypothetical protein